MRSAKFLLSSIVCLFATLGWIGAVSAEGTAEVPANQYIQKTTALYVDIVDSAVERIRWTGRGALTIRDPSDSVVQVLPSGGTSDPLTLNGNGPYHVIMAQDQNSDWSIEVVNAVNSGGRLHSKNWVFDTGTYSANGALDASFYAITPGGAPSSDAVMEVKFTGMSGYAYNIGMNSSGITGANSRSTPVSNNSFVPEYDLYLNPPSIAVGGAVVPTLSNFQYIPPGNGCNLQGSGGDPGAFSFNSDATGSYKIICDINQDGVFDITSPGDLLLSGDATVGTNTVAWNGTDRNGNSITTDTYTCQGFLTVGEVHFVGADIETSYEGLRMFKYDVTTGARSSVSMYWNDTLVQSNAVNMPNGQKGIENPGPNGMASGAYTAAAVANVNARAWGNFNMNSKGNNAYLDTFAFATSSNTQSVFIEVVDNTVDSDGDNLTDVDETCIYGTDPDNADTDGDTLDDDVEVAGATDPLDPCDPMLGSACALSVEIIAPADGLVTNDNTQAVTGTTDPFQTVALLLDGVVIGTTVSDAAGAFAFNEATVGVLPDGLHTFTARVDGALAGSRSDTNTITVDTAAPAVTLVAPADGLITNQTSIPASGTTEPNTSVALTVDANVVATTTSDGAGAFSFTATQVGTLAAGSHTFVATATDAAGNIAQDSATVVVDTTPPTITLAAPADGLVTNDNSQEASGATEASIEVELFVDSTLRATVTSSAAGAFSFTAAQVGTLSDGAHSFRVVATDAAGNTAEVTNTITVDTAAPAISLDTPADGLATSDNTLSASGTTEANLTVELFVDNVSHGTTTASATGAFTFTEAEVGTLADGGHTIRTVVTDAAGNTASDSVAISVDTVEPLLTLVNPVDGLVTNDNTQAANGVTDALQDVELFVDGVSVGITTANAAGLYAFTEATIGTLPDGEHIFRVVATDAVGNITEVTNTITVDTAAPSIALTAPADGGTTPLDTTVVGTTEPDTAVVVTLDAGTADEQVFNVTSNATGGFSVSVTVVGGPHTIDAVATDVAGNDATASSTFDAYAITLVLDTPVDGGQTASSRPAVSGSTDPNIVVSIVFDEGLATEELITTTSDASGNFYVFPLNTLPDGAHTVKASVTDPLIGTTISQTNSFEIDTVGFLLTVDSPSDGSVISDSAPTLSGTTEPGATVAVVVDEGTPAEQVLTAIADALGAWSVDSATLADGTHAATASVSDTLGNETRVGVVFTVDTDTTVAITSPQDGAVSPVDVTTITGRSEPLVGIEVGVGNQTVTTTADMTGAWSVALTTPLGDGNYTVTATATDALGNTAQATSTFDVDTSLPFLTLATPAAGALLNTTPTVAGQADPNAMVTILLDGVEVGTATADANGDWTFAFTTPLADGPHSVTAEVTDVNTASITNDFTIDSAIALTVDSPADGSSVSTATPILRGTSDPGAIIEVSQGNEVLTTVADDAGNWSLQLVAPLTPDGDGNFVIHVTAMDGAGNTTAMDHSFTVDGLAPDMRISQPDNAATTNEPSLPIVGFTEPNLSVTVMVDAGLPGQQTLTTTADAAGLWTVTPAPLSEGRHTVDASAADLAGNVGVDSVEFIVDSRAPDLVITSPEEMATYDKGPITVTGTSEPNAEILLFVNGTSLGTATADSNGVWSIEVPAAADGTYDVRARTFDAVGNVAEDEVRFVIAAPDPLLTIVQPLDGAVVQSGLVTVAGTANPGEIVTITIDGVEVGTVSSDDNGEWTFDTAELNEGDHTLAATGEFGGTASVDLTVDTSAPAVTITSPTQGQTTGDTISVTGTAEPGATVEVFVDGASVGTTTADANGDWTFEVGPLDDGDHTVEATTEDEAGNLGTSGEVSIGVDTTPPIVTVIDPTDGGAYTTPPIITGTGEPDTTVIVAIDDGDPIEVIVGADGTWSVDPGDIGPGEHTIVVTSRDPAGNESDPITIVITVEEDTPEVTDFEITGGCSSASGTDASLMALALLGLVGWRRRRS